MIINEIDAAFSGESKLRKCSLEIRSGKIYRISEHSLNGSEVIDGRGFTAFPGVIDPHVHFNTPGFEEREDFYHGSCFAASGGVTTVIDMPCTSIPPVTSLQNFLIKKKAVEKMSIIDYSFYGGVSKQSLPDIEKNLTELSENIAGVKIYLTSGMESFQALSYEELERVFRVCAKLKLPVLIHAEDSEYIEKSEKIEMLAGSNPRNYYNSRPEVAELIAIQGAGELVRKTGADVHIVHVSSGLAVKIAIQYGMTVETCPHYLSFDLRDFIKMGSVLKVAPVIKDYPAKNELWQLLEIGKINFIASDHAACGKSSKKGINIWEDYSGIAGCGTMFPYLYSEGYAARRICLPRMLEIVSENAAKRYGLADRKGKIKEGMDADLVIIDKNGKTTIEAEKFLSKGELTPWEGCEFMGKIKFTIRRGEIIYSDVGGILAERGSGKYLKPAK